ncbi:MAG TPA: FAD-binding oxidoreductase [Caulobacteraceae bacterium]|nr:FAD-binding oxidoreductase [Caulobacteraceae bacterium]
MHRREWLKGAAAVSLGTALPAVAAPVRRMRPGDAAWPSSGAWEGLGRAVGGRLIKPVSLTAPCEADAHGAACAERLKDLANPFFIGDQAGGTQVSGWLDAWSPKLSAYAVEARDAADVVAAVNFARSHNLRLVVKGGGHSYQGGSNAPDSLLVWTRAMNAITVHDAFTPKGTAGPAVQAVSIGAGAMWVDAYDAVTTRAGRYVQGGGCATVGVAGLTLGGGFGSFSKQYGTAAASLLEAEIVTADGAVRIVNAANHPDLFWALKGGGQSAFGVVTRLTLQTHALADLAGGCGGGISATNEAAFRRAVHAFVETYAERLNNPHWGESVRITRSNRIEFNMVFQGLTSKEATDAWRPLIDWAAAAGPDIKLDGPHLAAQPMREWWDFAAAAKTHAPWVRPDTRPGAPPHHAWWSGDSGQVSAFLYAYDSLWLPNRLLGPDDRGHLADALFEASRQFNIELHFNKGLGGGAPAAVAHSAATATNPAVLDAFALAIIATGGLPNYPPYPPTDLAEARREAARIDAATAKLRPLAPAGGSYVSESNYFNPRWREAFWGPHYARLAAVKARYDPAGLFVMHHGVGSEAWSADGFTRLG